MSVDLAQLVLGEPCPIEGCKGKVRGQACTLSATGAEADRVHLVRVEALEEFAAREADTLAPPAPHEHPDYEI